MIYFDNASTGGFKPDGVVIATVAALKFCANPGRSGHKLSLACLERVYACRKQLCTFFNAYSYDRVIFTKNCTEALNIAILGVIKEGDEVVTTVAEHNSVLRPLERLKDNGITVKYAPLDGDGNIDVKALAELVTDKTRAVIMTLASNVTGAAPDVKAVRKSIPEHCLLICDGAQACGHIKIDMKSLKIDALAVAGHKGMLGIQGSGALIFSERINPAPVLYGGTGSESHSLKMPDFYPDALESGTLSYPAVVSLGEGTLYLRQNMQKNGEKILKLTTYLCENLCKIDGLKMYSKPNPFGIVTFNLDNVQAEVASSVLSEKYGICVRGGLHCAPLMHKALNSEGLVRASVSAFNSINECDQFVRAVTEISEATADDLQQGF
ncbi:MAG: aminotransferase class V-fold PLP-dependent enzyme [Clostridia bacterium]|nr:aminotransferase class V-fold PLP-dependent enzyme [Clostridia bacterium]